MPSLWSSMVVARLGCGDMAVSNALGANIFSILVGLGMPWFSYALYTQRNYDGIKDMVTRRFVSSVSRDIGGKGRTTQCEVLTCDRWE